jgi:hypothetical protein
MPDRDVGDDNGRSTDRLLGELIAEVRGAKHATNNLAQKVDAIGPIAATANEALKLATEVKQEQDKHNFRIAVLEADKHRREGAVGLVEWLARHWPFTVIIAAVVAFVAWANGVDV